MTAPRRSRAILIGLAVLATLIVGGAAVHRVSRASRGAKEAVARHFRPAPVPMQASLLAEAVAPPETAPAADLAHQDSLREFQGAFENAWREGLAQAATATADPPTGSASADAPTASDTPATTAVADVPIASASASADPPTAMGAPTASANPQPVIAPPTPTAPPPMAAATTSATAAPPMVVAALTRAAIAADAGDLHVVIYSASWCPACQEAKAWMTAHGIPFEERDIDASAENVLELRLLNWRMSIPTFEIDGQVTVGFSPRRLALMLQRAALRRRGGGAPN